MGKVSKKSTGQVKDGAAGQTKISSFFKNGPAKENQPKERTLFKQVGVASRKDLTVLGKPMPKSCTGNLTVDLNKEKSVQKGGNPARKELSPTQAVVIPETQGRNSPKVTESPCIDVARSNSSEGNFCVSDCGASDDDGVIPDTPEVLAPARPKAYNRSFLRPVTLLTKQPDLKPTPSKAEQQQQQQRRQLTHIKNRNSTGSVTVTFNSANGNKGNEEQNEISSNFTNIVDVVELSEKEESVEKQATQSPSSPVEKNASRKRSAIPGISPSPKRSMNKPLRSGETLPPVKFKSNTGSVSPVSCNSRTSTPKGRLLKPSGKQVKRLNAYQCSMQHKTNIIEDSSFTCADDDILADILGELHTQLDKYPSSSGNADNASKTSSKNSKCLKILNTCTSAGNREEQLTSCGSTLAKETSSTLETSNDTAIPQNCGVAMEIASMTPETRTANDVDLTCVTASDCEAGVETVSENNHETASIGSGNETSSGNVVSMETVDEEVKTSCDGSPTGDVTDAIPDDSFMEMAGNWSSESQELCQEFNSLSTFKAKRAHQTSSCDPRLTKPPAHQFGRHKVTCVQFDRQRHELILEVECVSDKKKRFCHLQGFWSDTKVEVGDIVNILDVTFDPTDNCYITDSCGLIVIHPDRLISGTSVVSGVHCLRRSVLNEIFKGCDSSNIHMLHGSVIHAFFQEAVQKGVYESKQLTEIGRNVIQQNKFLHEMYSQNSSEDTVQAEVIKYIPPFQSWLQKFTNIGKFALGSQRFGVKGKIDLTVDVKMWGKSGKPETKVVPLELKTGKATYSVEHKGQVTLYSMMSSDRRDDPSQGLLLYLKEGGMQSIPVNNANKGGLIQLRNDMANYLQHRLQSVTRDNGKEERVIGQLPDPINSRRTCEKCPQNLNCAIYAREFEKREFPAGHAMLELLPATLSHLTQTHLDYFTHWCYMLELESAHGKSGKNVREIWTVPAIEREKSGDCLSGMSLSSTEVVDSFQYILTFQRHPVHPSHHYSPLDKCGLSPNETLVISTENKTLIALCMGSCVAITRDHIKISTDRDLSGSEYAGNVYRLDRCDIFNTMGLYFTNLSKLMGDNSVSANLRRLLIEVDKPVFLPTLSKGAIEKVRGIFKSLNKPQKTAILKVLMSKDYILIKGYPGTGKTSTIVALVKILKQLGHSVLLASYTHSAVDNILLKLKNDGLNFLRLGRSARIHPAVRPFAAENLVKDFTSVADLRSFYASQDIVATTCLGSNHVIFTQRKFDVCIVDEASQVLQPACLGPLFAAEKFVLVGDHKQLPPVVQSREAKALGMADSLFSRLDTSGVTYELNLQYRMNSQIMELSNELIYGGALQCGSQSVATSCLKLSTNQDSLQELLATSWISSALSDSLDQAAVFLDTNQVPAPESKDSCGLIRNQVEAELVAVLAECFVMAGVDPEEIGVIAPYRNQVKVIQTLLTSGNHGNIEVNTVDQYQGRDKRVIIISFVKSSRDEGAAIGELLKDIRRLNVAVTRAKHKLVLVGDKQTLSRYEPVLKIISVLEKHNQIIPLPVDAHKNISIPSRKQQ